MIYEIPKYKIASCPEKHRAPSPQNLGGFRNDNDSLRAQVHLHARQVLDTGDAHTAFAELQAYPGAGSYIVRHLEGERHVGTIGVGGKEQLVVTDHRAIGGDQLCQHHLLGRLCQPADDDRPTLDKMVGGGLTDHNRLLKVTGGGDVAGTHGEQDQVDRVDRDRPTERVVHAHPELAKLRHAAQLKLDGWVHVDPVYGFIDQPVHLAIEQAGLALRLERLDPDFRSVGARRDATQVGDQPERRSHPGHRSRLLDLHTRIGDGGCGGDGRRAGWATGAGGKQVLGGRSARSWGGSDNGVDSRGGGGIERQRCGAGSVGSGDHLSGWGGGEALCILQSSHHWRGGNLRCLACLVSEGDDGRNVINRVRCRRGGVDQV